MTIYFRQEGSAIILFGNTFPVREHIKQLGGRFYGPDKTWRLPTTPENLTRVSQLCRDLGGGALGIPQEDSPQTTPIRIESRGISVRDLVDKIHGVIANAFADALWVTGELQNVAIRGGSIFFDLAEGRENQHQNATITIKTVIWSQAMSFLKSKHTSQKIDDILQDGMKVLILCRVQFYKDRAQMSLVVEDIDPDFTKGALALEREKLLIELRSKGLDKANKSLALPPFPFRVGLITAEGSRAKSDFLDQLFELGFPGEVVFCHSQVQGEKVPTDIAKAIFRLEQAKVDVIVITRGGGSAADLRWFDAREVAYAIATAKVPIIAAIGHHDDICVAEEICFLRQKTPTAAADFIIQVFTQTKERIDYLSQNLARTLTHRLDSGVKIVFQMAERLFSEAKLAHLRREKKLADLTHALTQGSLQVHFLALQKLQRLQSSLREVAVNKLNQLHMNLEQLAASLKEKDPRPWLTQGWTQVSMGGKSVSRTSQVKLKDKVKIRLIDGWMNLEVIEIKPTKKPEGTP